MKFIIFLVLFLLLPMNIADINTSHAQCGGVYTSCFICHNIRKELPISYDDLWHRDHSFGQICDFCHGGGINLRYKEDAHYELIAKPLNNSKKICSPCHKDYETRVNKYELFLKEKKKKADKEPEKTESKTNNESGIKK